MEEEAAFFDTRLVAGHQVQSVETTRFSGQRRARELVSPASLFFFFFWGLSFLVKIKIIVLSLDYIGMYYVNSEFCVS